MANGEDQPPALQEVVARKKAKGGGNKRRFNDDQIRSLESMFEEEAKLEPGKKVRLAMDLGLQPRQVAIWFQNRRARWKSKKLEREYSILKANYDALSSSFESLMKEKQSLFKQLQRLKEQLGVAEKEGGRTSRTVVPDLEWEEKPKVVVKEGGDQQLGGVLLNGCGGMHEEKIMSSILERLGPEESDLMAFTDPVNGSSITWPEEWGDVDSGSFSDQSCTTMDWWDVWS